MFELPLYLQQICVAVITLILFIFLIIEKYTPAIIFFTAVLLFLLLGIISIHDFLVALSNESILSIFLLIFITFGIKNNFNLFGFFDRFYGKAKTGKGFLLRMTSSVTALSGVLNNTPIVAAFMPYVYQWSRQHKTSPSKFLIPLSFAAMLGGMLTVIGTSTNLVLKGLVESEKARPPGFLDYLLPGLLVSIAGLAYLYFFAYKRLPERKKWLSKIANSRRKYLMELKIVPDSHIVGKSIMDAELRDLDDIYLFAIIRQNRKIAPVAPTEILEQDDTLIFVGETQNIFEFLNRNQELMMPKIGGEPIDFSKFNPLETVISINSNLIGKTLKSIRYRENYDAAVIAIYRNGEKIIGKVGEIILQAGDLLLLVPGQNFKQLNRERQDLYMVSVIKTKPKATRKVRWGFMSLLLTLICLMVFEKISLFLSLLLLLSYMIAFGVLTISIIKRELDVNLLIVLVCSLTFSTALINSGLAELIAENMMLGFQPWGDKGIVVGIYLITLILTSFVTHVAALSIVFPIAYTIAAEHGSLSMTAVFISIAFAASASFHSPFSYQTNMMIYEPGGYRFKDFLKIGAPLTLIYSLLTLSFIFIYYGI